MVTRTDLTDEELDILRLKAKYKFRFVLILAGIFFLLIILVQLYFTWKESQKMWSRPPDVPYEMIMAVVLSAALTIPVTIVLYSLIADRACDRFQFAYKDSCVLNVVRGLELYEDLVYDRKGGISFQEFYEAAVAESGVKWLLISKDKLTGRYKGFPFTFGNVQTRILRKYGSTMRVESLFYGQVIRFKMLDGVKISQGYLQIFPKKFILQHSSRVAKYKFITENVEFNNKFDIYASDTFSACDILTSGFMGKVMELSDQAEAKLAISFTGSVMTVAVNRKYSVFHAKLDRPVAEQKQQIPKDLKILQTACEIFYDLERKNVM